MLAQLKKQKKKNASSQRILLYRKSRAIDFETYTYENGVTCSLCDLEGAPRIDQAFEKLKKLLLAKLMRNASMMLCSAKNASTQRKWFSRGTNPHTHLVSY
jgi:hypothetical protein